MSSPHVHELLSAYVDGVLTDSDRQRVDAHLRTCRECAQYWGTLRQTVDLVRSLPEEEPPTSLRESVMALIREEAAAESRNPGPKPVAGGSSLPKRWGRWYRSMAVAAGIALLIGTGYVVSLLHTGLGMPASQIAERDSGGMSPLSGATSVAQNDAGAGVQPFVAADSERVSGAAEAVTAGRRIIQRGYAEVEVDDVKQAFRAIADLAGSLGGYVENSSLATDALGNDHPGVRAQPQASLVVRVPAGGLPGFWAGLDQIGTVIRSSTSSDDITEQYVDTESRLRNLTAQELRYLNLLEEADSVDEVLRVENEIWRIRGEIEALQGRLQQWDRLVDLAAVEVDLRTTDQIGLGNRLLRAWKGAVNAAIVGIEYMIIGAGAVMPWAILGIAAWLGVRRWRFVAGQGRDT